MGNENETMENLDDWLYTEYGKMSRDQLAQEAAIVDDEYTKLVDGLDISEDDKARLFRLTAIALLIVTRISSMDTVHQMFFGKEAAGLKEDR